MIAKRKNLTKHPLFLYKDRILITTMKISQLTKILICILTISIFMTNGINITLGDPNDAYHERSSNRMVSSELKSLDMRDPPKNIAYEVESEQPRLSAIMQRPTVGNVKILAIPVYFYDMIPIIPENLIEERWDVHVRDYYHENSYDLLSINSYVTPWIEAPKSVSYYADDDYSSTREIELAQFLLSYWDATFNSRIIS